MVKDITENLLLWDQRIKEKAESGMTIDQWCDKNKLSKHKYHYWNHCIKKNQKQDKEMTFAEVTPILSILEKLKQARKRFYFARMWKVFCKCFL